MKAFQPYFLLFFVLGISSGCQQQQSNQQTEQADDQAVVLQDFPKVTHIGPQALQIDVYSLHFQLSYPAGITAYTNAQIPWLDPNNLSDASGNVISFLRNNDPLRLDKANIRLSYIRKQPEQAHVEALMEWVGNTFVVGQGGRYMKEQAEVATQSGLKAQAVEIYMPAQANGRSERYMAFAYLDPGEDYMLGFMLSAISQPDFEGMRSSFYEMIGSYQ